MKRELIVEVEIINKEKQAGVIAAESAIDQKLIEKSATSVSVSQVAQRIEVEALPEKGSGHKISSYFVRGGAALRHRNYRLFFFGQLVSLVGTWMQNVAQVWLVLKLTNSPFALGLTTALQFLPVMCLSLFGGLIADRLPKRATLVVTQSAAMTLAYILAILTTFNAVQLWEVYVLAALLGLVNAIDMPVRQSFVPEMVGKGDLVNAIALNSSIFNAARVVGPAVAGLLIGIVGLAPAFWINGFSYIAVIVGLILMQSKDFFLGEKRKQTGTIRKNLKEGLSYTYNTPAIFTIVVLVGIVGTFGINFNVWIPVIAKNFLHVGADGYGVLMAGLGIGALASALVLAALNRKPSTNAVLKAVAGFVVFGLVIAYSSWFFVTLFCLVGLGASMIVVMASANTIIQITTPDYLRGRVMSIYMLVFAGTTPIGGLFVGWLASAVSTPFSMATGMVLSGLAIPTVWLVLRSQKAKEQKQLVTEKI